MSEAAPVRRRALCLPLAIWRAGQIERAAISRERHAPSMSLTSTTVAPAAIKAGATLLRATSLTAMGRTVAVVVCAGLLAAIYQVAQDELRAAVQGLHKRHRFDRARDEFVILHVLGSNLEADLQDSLLRARNPIKRIVAMLSEPDTSEEVRRELRQIVRSTLGIARSV